jgi:hypothetical protein
MGNAGQARLTFRPQGRMLLALIRVGLRSEGLQARKPHPALMKHQNHHGFRMQDFADTPELTL